MYVCGQCFSIIYVHVVRSTKGLVGAKDIRQRRSQSAPSLPPPPPPVIVALGESMPFTSCETRRRSGDATPTQPTAFAIHEHTVTLMAPSVFFFLSVPLLLHSTRSPFPLPCRFCCLCWHPIAQQYRQSPAAARRRDCTALLAIRSLLCAFLNRFCRPACCAVFYHFCGPSTHTRAAQA